MTFIILIIGIILLLVLSIDKLDSEFFEINEIEPKLKILEKNFLIIKNDIIKLKKNWVKWPETGLYEKNQWKIIPIYAFGKWVSKYKKYFKNTLNIIEKVPNIETILFSRLESKSIIHPHQGWAKLSNRVLRCHLPLIVKKGNYIGVNNKKKFHQEGRLIIFDDSKEHYSVNLSDKDRIVLIIDIKRPIWVKPGISNIPETPQLLKIIDTYLV